jgi:hypothetical protein
MITEQIDCQFCMSRHTRRYACDPVLAMLDAMRARGEGLNMPPMTFDEPIFPGFGPEDSLLAGVTVAAATIPTEANVTYPALVFSGNRLSGPLPRWIYPGTPDTLRATARLVDEMTELAIKTAAAP